MRYPSPQLIQITRAIYNTYPKMSNYLIIIEEVRGQGNTTTWEEHFGMHPLPPWPNVKKA